MTARLAKPLTGYRAGDMAERASWAAAGPVSGRWREALAEIDAATAFADALPLGSCRPAFDLPQKEFRPLAQRVCARIRVVLKSLQRNATKLLSVGGPIGGLVDANAGQGQDQALKGADPDGCLAEFAGQNAHAFLVFSAADHRFGSFRLSIRMEPRVGGGGEPAPVEGGR